MQKSDFEEEGSSIDCEGTEKHHRKLKKDVGETALVIKVLLIIQKIQTHIN